MQFINLYVLIMSVCVFVHQTDEAGGYKEFLAAVKQMESLSVAVCHEKEVWAKYNITSDTVSIFRKVQTHTFLSECVNNTVCKCVSVRRLMFIRNTSSCQKQRRLMPTASCASSPSITFTTSQSTIKRYSKHKLDRCCQTVLNEKSSVRNLVFVCVSLQWVCFSPR